MIEIDDNFLQQVGLTGLSAQDQDMAKARIANEIERRVSDNLINQLSDAQLDEFEKYVTNVDPAGGATWLEKTIPDYPAVFGQEIEKLKSEIQTGGLESVKAFTEEADD